MSADDAARVVAFLNEAKITSDNSAKSFALAQVAELLVKKRPDLIARFIAPILELTADPAAPLRQFVAQFAEAALQHNQQLVHTPGLLEALLRLVQDKNGGVAKKAIACCTYMFPGALKAVGELPLTKAQVMNKQLDSIKDAILGLLTAVPPPPTATQVQCFKFVESLVMVYRWGFAAPLFFHCRLLKLHSLAMRLPWALRRSLWVRRCTSNRRKAL
jgi:hypothetical protein